MATERASKIMKTYPQKYDPEDGTKKGVCWCDIKCYWSE